MASNRTFNFCGLRNGAMSTASPDGGDPPLSPDDAFAVLGNATRMNILQTLADADGPMAFSELQKRSDVSDSGQFNYHLGKLEGHFIAATDGGYQLRQPGRWVVGAVLSGAVTADPTIDRTPVDFDCLLCDAPMELAYIGGRVELYCTECAGVYGGQTETLGVVHERGHGFVGAMGLPSAGVQGRSPDELLNAASVWAHLNLLAAANGVCPLCSATLDSQPVVCADHDTSSGLCPDCDRRHLVQVTRRCTNCLYRSVGPFVSHLFGNLELRLFIGEHGIDPIVDGLDWGWEYEEAVSRADPFEARFTFTVDGDSITLTVDEQLEVIDIQERRATDTA